MTPQEMISAAEASPCATARFNSLTLEINGRVQIWTIGDKEVTASRAEDYLADHTPIGPQD